MGPRRAGGGHRRSLVRAQCLSPRLPPRRRRIRKQACNARGKNKQGGGRARGIEAAGVKCAACGLPVRCFAGGVAEQYGTGTGAPAKAGLLYIGCRAQGRLCGQGRNDERQAAVRPRVRPGAGAVPAPTPALHPRRRRTRKRACNVRGGRARFGRKAAACLMKRVAFLARVR